MGLVVDADLPVAEITPEVDIDNASVRFEGVLQLLEATNVIRLARERALQIELERHSPTLRRPVSRRADPLGRGVVTLIMAMVMVAAGAVLMLWLMAVIIVAMMVMAMIIMSVRGTMVMLAVGAVDMLHAQPLDEGFLAPSARDDPDQPRELLRLRHVAP
jgi:hypothetical protein